MRLGWTSVGLAVLGVAVAVGTGGAQGPKELKVDLKNSAGQSVGSATFKTVKRGVRIHISLENMQFGAHAVHIHEHAVCDAPDFKGAGPHFNPDGKKHGYENPNGHHNGDMPGNVMVGEDHMGEATFVLKTVSLDPSAPNSLFTDGGTSIVVHEHADDMMSDPSGNSGNRVACGVIKQ